MAELVISPPKQFIPLPHIVLINGQELGIIKNDAVHIRLPKGLYTVTIRSAYRFIESSTAVQVNDGTMTTLSFADREQVWNWLFNIDLVLWLVKFFFSLPEPWDTVYEVLSNGFFAIWLVRLWLIRKHYFKLQVQWLSSADYHPHSKRPYEP